MQIEIERTDENREHMIIKVPVPKATRKNDASWVEVDLELLPQDVLKEIYLQGCKTLLNRGMSKITGEKDDKSVKAVMEIAGKNLEDMYAGKVRMSAGVRTKITGAVKTEAMRIARQIIKDGLKAEGLKVSHYSAKDITEAATKFLESDDGKEVWDEAKSAVEARTEKEKKAKEGVKGIVTDLVADPKLVQKAEEAAAKRKKPSKEEAKVTLAAAAAKGQQGRQGQHQQH